MQFRNGMLGVAVIAVALAAALLGSWVMSMDVNEIEVTKYNALADVTPLFGSEPAPEYIEYNPTSNYTGYYTSDTVVGETTYFGGVDYKSSDKANNFKLNLKPIDEQTGITFSLSEVASDDETWLYRYWLDNDTVSEGTILHKSLLQYAKDLNADEIDLISDFGSYTTGGFLTFITSDMLRNPAVQGAYDKLIYQKVPTLTGTLTYRAPGVPQALWPTFEAKDIGNPILACKYDKTTGTVTLYSDVDMTKSIGTYAPSKVFIVWSNSTSGSFHLGNSGTMNYIDLPDPEYMDPSAGVELL